MSLPVHALEGGTGTTSVTITVNPPVPVISYSPSTNVYVQGVAITTLTPTNTGGPVLTWAISPALPAGLSFNTSTGVLSGTPAAVQAALIRSPSPHKTA